MAVRQPRFPVALTSSTFESFIRIYCPTRSMVASDTAVGSMSAAKIPSLVYGTAWKAERTQALVKEALLTGFRGVDTAAQPKHYREDLVGAGIRDALKDGSIQRADLYVQTKFTSVQGQDPKNMPYDPKSSITEQVNKSIASSLKNLRYSDNASDQSYLDGLVLHSPLPTMPQTLEAWRAMESHVPRNVRSLGISNCYRLPVLHELFENATIKPSVLQNRLYADSGYDTDVRAFCEANGILYQSFWTLTANPNLLRSQPVSILAEQAHVSKAVALYGLVLGLGNISVLNGTTNAQRMSEDLSGVEGIKQWASHNADSWKSIQKDFQNLLI